MRILVVVKSLTAGGAERQAVQDANLLSASGHEMTFCFGVAGPLKSQLDRKIRCLDLGTSSQWKACYALACAIRKHGIEMVFSHMFWANKIAMVACWITCRKNVAFEHGLGLWRKWYHLLFVRWIAKKAFWIVVGSEASRRIRIGREKAPAGKVKVIFNSIAVPSVIRSATQAQIKTDDGCFIIGYTGRFHKVKQLPILVEVALRLKQETSNFRFIMMGDGEEKATMEKMVLDKGIGDHFDFLGYIADPLTLLPTMDCFILPSKREEFSLALLEASYCGLPCIAFDVGGNGEIIASGVTGWLIEPFQVDRMAEKILWFIRNPKKAKAMGDSARRRAMMLFSQEQRLAKLTALIMVAVG